MYKKFNDITQLKSKFQIVEYLSHLGITPVCKKSSYALYHAPYRVDRNPSCIVYRNTNTFLDLSTRQKGDIIELVKLMNCCDFKQAVSHLLKNTGVVPAFDNCTIHKPSQINILDTSEICSIALQKYLLERRIPIDIANRYCKEVRYVMGENIYYAIGFSNNKNGWELRSKNYKGCTSKHITTIIETDDSSDYMVFEGFFDFLSFKAIYPHVEGNAIILNSVCNLLMGLKELESLGATDIYVYGDTDVEGERVFERIKDKYGDRAVDMSYFYKQNNCKDLNEYLVKCNPKKLLRL